MKFLEVIELRSADFHRTDLEPVVHRLIKDVSEKAGEHNITAYCHMTIDTDFRIHLVHESMEAQSQGSPLGLQLAVTLKEYGLVNHSLWAEAGTGK